MEKESVLMKQITGRIRTGFLSAATLFLFGFAGIGRAAAANGPMTVVEHTVVKGDNLMLLAGYYFKDPRQWRRIYGENSAVLDNPHLLIPGTVLRIATTDLERWHIPYEEFAARAGN